MIYSEPLPFGDIWTPFQCIPTETLQKTSAICFDL